MHTNTPRDISDETIVDAVRRLYERHETDNGNGGVHSSYVASYLDISERRVRAKLRRLAERDELEPIQGIDPETGLSRRSYVPADES